MAGPAGGPEHSFRDEMINFGETLLRRRLGNESCIKMTTLDRASITELLSRKAAENPGGVFAVFHDVTITFAALEQQASSLAADLAARGLQAGDRVAVMMQNSPEVLPVVFGLAKAGLVWVPLNAKQRGEGLRYVLEHAKPSLVITDEYLVDVITDSSASIPADRILVHGERRPYACLSGILTGGTMFNGPAPAPDAPFAIMYTSGTTGRPKGVIVSHYMMRCSGEAAALVSAIKPDDTMFVWEPLYHIGGAQLLSLPMTRGVRLALVTRFSASRFWDQVRQFQATHIHYLGGILQILLKQPASAGDRNHRVRSAWGGGCPAEIWTEFQNRFNVEIRECYGMTEASSITTVNDNRVVGSVGKPVPWFSVQLLAQDGAVVPQGERGEIIVRTNEPGAIFPGYLNDPEATAKALRQGALHTGDLGSFDAMGNLFFHGRMTESVRCRGENVSAWEVEHAAADHPAVEECAMIGVAADIGEQDIKLFVKQRDGGRIDPAELSKWLSSRLAPYQVPRYIAIVNDFDRTPSQRIMKHKLSRALDDCWDRIAWARAEAAPA
jgi:crotonobetaine/carnitine-CoA ligase